MSQISYSTERTFTNKTRTWSEIGGIILKSGNDRIYVSTLPERLRSGLANKNWTKIINEINLV